MLSSLAPHCTVKGGAFEANGAQGWSKQNWQTCWVAVSELWMSMACLHALLTLKMTCNSNSAGDSPCSGCNDHQDTSGSRRQEQLTICPE